jgi:uncharacterized protein YodC (DUF2158 family)
MVYATSVLYMQLWYGIFYMHWYKQSSRQKSVFKPLGMKHVEDINIKI